MIEATQKESTNVEETLSLVFALVFTIYKYNINYNTSLHKGRKPREVKKAYVKDYLKDI